MDKFVEPKPSAVLDNNTLREIKVNFWYHPLKWRNLEQCDAPFTWRPAGVSPGRGRRNNKRSHN